MRTPNSKDDLFALPIPAERVTLRIANSAVSTISQPPSHSPSASISPTPMYPQQLDGLDLLNIHWAAWPIVKSVN
jgi:hypothetical protein